MTPSSMKAARPSLVVTPPARSVRPLTVLSGTSLKNGTPLGIGDRPNDRRPVASLQGKVVYDTPMFGTRYGQATQQPQDAIAGRQEVSLLVSWVRTRTTTCITTVATL